MQSSVNNILTLLTDKGYLISQQRRIIICTICETQEIGSIEDFWLHIRRHHRISWATVHKTIKLLVEVGCVIPTCTKDRQQHFVFHFEEME